MSLYMFSSHLLPNQHNSTTESPHYYITDRTTLKNHHICHSPLPPVSWALSKQRDWLSKCSEPSFHLGIICGDGYLPGSSTTLEGSECFLLPFADTVF